MTTPNPSTPIRVVEAKTGVHLAQAAGLWLRTSRDGEPWRSDHSGRVLLAFAGDTPVAVAELGATQFGTPAIRRFRAALRTDSRRARELLIDFLGAAPGVGRNSDRLLAAVAA